MRQQTLNEQDNVKVLTLFRHIYTKIKDLLLLLSIFKTTDVECRHAVGLADSVIYLPVIRNNARERVEVLPFFCLSKEVQNQSDSLNSL